MVLFGALIWVVPYTLSMALFPTGILTNNVELFEIIMTLSGSVTALIATIYYFKGEKARDVRTAWTLLLIWVITNWLLDFAFLMPYIGYDFLSYFLELGLGYFAMAAFPLAVAYTQTKKK